jgi:hypothetical protein
MLFQVSPVHWGPHVPEQEAGDKAVFHLRTPLVPQHWHERKQQPHHAVLHAKAQCIADQTSKSDGLLW